MPTQITRPDLPPESGHDPAASDRSPQTPRSGDNPRRSLTDVLGIDWLELKIWIHRPDPRRWETHSTHRKPTSTRAHQGLHITLEPCPGFQIDMYAYTVPDFGWRCSISYNPSHHPAWTDPWAACSLDCLGDVTNDVWRFAQPLITPEQPTGQAQVARIDIARNFTIPRSQQQALLHAWSACPVKRATRRPLWHSAAGEPEGFSTGNKTQGMVRGYDHARKHGSPPSTFRVEVEARHGWAATYGAINVEADISADAVQRLFMSRYEYACLHRPVVHEAVYLDRLRALAEGPDPILTVGRLPGLVGREHLAINGIVLPEGHSTRSERRKVIDHVGVAHHDHNAPRTIRLDPHHDEPLVVAS